MHTAPVHARNLSKSAAKPHTDTNTDRIRVAERAASDPVWFARNILGVDPWSRQEEILRAIRDHRRVAVRSCHAAGKSTVTAWTVLWFLFTHRGAKVVTTAPTGRQVKDILWREIRTAYKRSRFPLGGRLLPADMRIEVSDDWFALGFSTDDGDRFQGYHAPHVLVVLDEASGVSPAIFEAMEGLTTSAGTRVLLIGNPTDPSGPFAKACQPDSIYHSIKIAAFDTPNFTGEREAPYLVTREWLEERLKDWGEDDPNWESRVLAEFPSEDQHTLIPLRLVEAARNREMDEADEPNILAVDVARYGRDSTVIAHRLGCRVRILKVASKQSTTETTGQVIHFLRETGATTVVVDDDGVGGGVTDNLVEQGIHVQPFINGSKAENTERFANLRSETYWGLRERLQQGDIVLPADERLAGELSRMRYGFTSRGQVKAESKDEMRQRGLKSPDVADAVMMAFARVDKKPVLRIPAMTSSSSTWKAVK